MFEKIINVLFNSEIKHYARSVFLLYLLIAGNYLGVTFSCGFQRILTNKIVQQFTVMLSLFFFIQITYDGTDDPIFSLISVIPVYLLYLISTKTETIPLLIFLLFVFISFFLELIKRHNSHMNNKLNKDTYYFENEKLVVIQKITFLTGVIVLLLGFMYYGKRKYKQYKHNWSTLKFIFGSDTCRK